MKNKLSKLFFLGSLFLTGSLMLSACDHGEGNYEPVDPPEPGPVDPSGEDKTDFPAEALKAFYASYDINANIPSPIKEGDWSYEVSEEESYFHASIADNGTVGVDALEDTYKKTLEETAGWVIDDSQYEAYGYYASCDSVTLQFFNYQGVFDFYAYVDNSAKSDEFPAQELKAFLTEQGSSTVVPSPVSSHEWSYSVTEASEDSSATFVAYTVDEGTIGTDSIEDTYQVLLKQDGWVVDDTYYDYFGYFADKDDVELLFYTYEGYFSISIYLASGASDEYEESETFPAKELEEFLASQKLSTAVPSPVSENGWFYKVSEDEDGLYFDAYTEDLGTIGRNSIEDTYSKSLNDDGWVIDDSEYDVYGYYATKGDVALQYFTDEDTFYFYANAYDGEPIEPVPAIEGEFTLVNDASSLKDGDVIVIGEVNQGVVAGHYDGKKCLESVNATFSSDGTTISNLSSSASLFNLNKSGDNWTLTSDEGVLGATDKKQLVFDQGTTTWNITIDEDDNALIASTNNSYGRILYNTGTPRFMNYASNTSDTMLLPEIYRLGEVEPVYPTDISLSGNADMKVGKSQTLDITFTPSNTNQKQVTWESNNTSVATVKDGVVKAVGEGKATITATAVGVNDSTLTASFVVNVVASTSTNASWTLMFYVCGSNLESERDEKTRQLSGLATMDIEEIVTTAGQPDDVNIIFETGGAAEWSKKYGIKNDELGRYYVENGSLVKDDALEDASMGAQDTFESFLTWGIESYPADRYGVFMWNHGGAMDGCCFDENYHDDSLTNAEINGALTNVEKELNLTNNLEFIAYDACLMAIQDVAEMNSHHFNYMLSSQESESGYGYDYDAWLPTLYADPSGVSTKTLLTKIGQTFLDEEQEYYEYWEEPFDQTQSVYDLSKMAAYKEAFEAVASGLSSLVNKSNWNSFVRNNISASNVQKYGADDGEYYFDIFDAEDVLDNIAKNYSSLSSLVATAKAALKDVVVWESHGNATSGCGMNIYCPMTEEYNRYYSSDTNFTNWYNLCKLSGLCIDK